MTQSFEWNRIGYESLGYRLNEDAVFSTTALSLRGQFGTLETGRLTLDLAGGITQSLTDDFYLPHRVVTPLGSSSLGHPWSMSSVSVT